MGHITEFWSCNFSPEFTGIRLKASGQDVGLLQLAHSSLQQQISALSCNQGKLATESSHGLIPRRFVSSLKNLPPCQRQLDLFDEEARTRGEICRRGEHHLEMSFESEESMLPTRVSSQELRGDLPQGGMGKFAVTKVEVRNLSQQDDDEVLVAKFQVLLHSSVILPSRYRAC